MEFEKHLPENILRLCADINTGKYIHGNYEHKIVNEKKRRDIAVANVRDRIVHRLLYDYLIVVCNNRFDYDVWSCRCGKGNAAALKRTKELLRKYSSSYLWRGDIQKFFDSIDQTILMSLLNRYGLDEKAYFLLDKVIKSYEVKLDRHIDDKLGIPIGNLTSQVLANVYLHEFDHFVRHSIKPLGYIRYGDDFLVISKTYKQAKAFQKSGITFLKDRLKLTIHTENNVIISVRHGIRYLGVTCYPKDNTLSNKTFNEILKKKSLVNQDSYISYVKKYGNNRQKVLISLSNLDSKIF